MFSFNNSNPLRELSVPDNYKSTKYQISPNSQNLKPYTWNRHLYSIRTKLLCFISDWCLTNSTAIPTNTKSAHDSFFFTCQLCQHVYPYSSIRNYRNISIPSCPQHLYLVITSNNSIKVLLNPKTYSTTMCKSYLTVDKLPQTILCVQTEFNCKQCLSNVLVPQYLYSIYINNEFFILFHSPEPIHVKYRFKLRITSGQMLCSMSFSQHRESTLRLPFYFD